MSRDAFTKLLGPLKDLTATSEKRKKDMDRRASGMGLEKSIKFSDLEIMSFLGMGTFGQVKLVKHRPSGRAFAMKILFKSRVVAFGQQKNVRHRHRFRVGSKKYV